MPREHPITPRTQRDAQMMNMARGVAGWTLPAALPRAAGGCREPLATRSAALGTAGRLQGKRSQPCCSSREADPSPCSAEQSSTLLLLLHGLQAIPWALPELDSALHTSAVPGETAARLP